MGIKEVRYARVIVLIFTMFVINMDIIKVKSIFEALIFGTNSRI